MSLDASGTLQLNTFALSFKVSGEWRVQQLAPGGSFHRPILHNKNHSFEFYFSKTSLYYELLFFFLGDRVTLCYHIQ